jgi:hypothetical protein
VLDHQPQQAAEFQKGAPRNIGSSDIWDHRSAFVVASGADAHSQKPSVLPRPRPPKRMVEALNPLLGQPACQIGICISMVFRVASSIYSMLTNEEV